jgi:hypothetical protein
MVHPHFVGWSPPVPPPMMLASSRLLSLESAMSRILSLLNRPIRLSAAMHPLSAVVVDDDDAPVGTESSRGGWHESSQDLRSGLTVQEDFGADARAPIHPHLPTRTR